LFSNKTRDAYYTKSRNDPDLNLLDESQGGSGERGQGSELGVVVQGTIYGGMDLSNTDSPISYKKKA